MREALLAGLFFGLLGGVAGGAAEVRGFQQATGPAPIVRQAPSHSAPAPANGFATRSTQTRPMQNQVHLQQWMHSHSNLPLDQQQRALENEPGFRQLNPEVQQRMHQRLAQLNQMTPEQRQRAYARTEAMERLAPEQREQFRNALTGLGELPKDRRMLVAQKFRALRDLPPSQRQAYLDSPAMRSQFSDGERQTLNGLFEIAPYLPAPSQVAPAPSMPTPPPR